MGHEQTRYVDHVVVNQDLETIGTVTDVLYDDGAGAPKWLIVKPGAFQAERFVPTAGSYTTDDGNIVVPFEKRWVKAAPKAGDHIMTSDVEDEATQHYDVEN